MNQSLDLTLVIPAFNEEKNLITFLPDVIQFCQENDFQLIIVNDASTDDSARILADFERIHPKLQVITHKVNRGYGGALISGLSAVYSEYAITIDADGQHSLEDIHKLIQKLHETNADLVVGKRADQHDSLAQSYRSLGKSIIRTIARIMMPLPVTDLNSGMKLYNTALVKKYLPLCPDSMAFSDVITLIFIQQKHLVVEEPINIQPRLEGSSTINTMTALETVLQIINIVMLFNPLKIFLPIGIILIILGLIWALPFLVQGSGLSTAALLLITTGMISIMLGLIAEQLAQIRKKDY
ncbi:MAG: glycosyltransferase family 2 protein [Chloroflexi bacterium]|jgi:glycosyltransferase involved in cell wall biosynthesis|nr:glycosyltransferase family 2 protein [Chloroflexota bacterium]